MHTQPSEDEAFDDPESASLHVLTVPEGTRGRLDKVLAGLMPEQSRNRLQEWIEAGHVRVNGAAVDSVRKRVLAGDHIEVVSQPLPHELAFTPECIPLDIVAESPAWVVVNKPAGLVVHPGAGNWQGTLLNGLLYRYPELRQLARAGIVHRLDKDTSGLMVVARTETARNALVRQLQARTVGREYLALVHGRLQQAGLIDRAIGRDARVPVRMSVERPIAPKIAITHYAAQRTGLLHDETQRVRKTSERKPQNSALAALLSVSEVVCRLETGRTHQIRVHMASIGHPLVGDVLYGGRQSVIASRQMLHARALCFHDPATGQMAEFTAPLPADMQIALNAVTWS